MNIQLIPERKVLAFRAETTLKEAPSFAGIIATKLYETAAAAGVLPTGPVTWVYSGADGKPETVFILEIVLPLNSKPERTGEFHFKHLPSFHCFEIPHIGEWQQLPRTYGHAMQQIAEQGFQLNGVCREEYTHMDFEQGVNNRTIVQIGIYPKN